MVPTDQILMVFGAAFFPVGITLTTLWLGARRRAVKAEEIVHQLAIAPALRGEHSGAATEQLSQALDAIAVEVERISENQRFTTKLLSERRDGMIPPSAPPRVNTPH
jgi:hypothetical protein